MEYKVIFHIDENAKWGLLLGNVENLLIAAEPGHITVEIVANSEAVFGYVPAKNDGRFTSAMARLHQKGVIFTACRNAMRGSNLTEKDLVPFAVPVPAGVMELAVRQAQGYSYIKP